MSSRAVRPSSPTAFKAFQAVFLAAVLCLPLFWGAVYLWSFSLSAGLAAAAFLWYWLTCRGWARPAEVRAGLEAPLAAYVLFFTLSAVQSVMPWRSGVEAFKLAGVVLFFAAARHCCRSRSDVRNFAAAFAVLGALLSLAGLFQLLGALPNPWWHRAHLLSSVYVNHNHFAGFLEIVLPLSAGLAFSERNIFKKALFFFFCALMGTAFLMTLSRGGIVSLAAASILVPLCRARRGILKPLALLVLGAGVLVGAAWLAFGLEPLMERFRALGNVQKEISRIHVWQGALSMIAARPWFGSGPGTFEHVFLLFRPAGFLGRPEFAHNDYLELWADAGLGAFLAAMAVFVSAAARAFRCAGDSESGTKTGLGTGAAVALAALGIHSFVDFNFHIPANWAIAAVAAGLVFSLEPPAKIASPRSRAIQVFVWPGLAAAVLAGSVVFGFSDYGLWKAKGLEEKGDGARAESCLNASLKLNPFNPAAWYEKGVLLERRRPGEAAACFERAVRLNPYEPYYRYHLARAFRRGAVKDPGAAAGAYGAALSMDTQDPKLIFLVARDLLAPGAPRDRRTEEYAKKLLAKAVTLNPGLARPVYDLLWRYEPSPEAMEAFQDRVPQSEGRFLQFLKSKSLWKYHRAHLLRSLGIDPLSSRTISAATKWDESSGEILKLEEFRPVSGKKVSEGSLLHGYGDVEREVAVKGRPARILLTAKGSKAAGAYPYVVVKVDGAVRDAVYIDNPLYARFESVLDVPPGKHTLGFCFVNDSAKSASGQERNIWIDRIELQVPA